MAKKATTEKLTIAEYQQRKALRDKKRFRIQFYPTPVLVALGIPFATLVFLILVYVMHIQGVAN